MDQLIGTLRHDLVDEDVAEVIVNGKVFVATNDIHGRCGLTCRGHRGYAGSRCQIMRSDNQWVIVSVEQTDIPIAI